MKPTKKQRFLHVLATIGVISEKYLLPVAEQIAISAIKK
jgi:hypothetical protein